MFNQSKKLVVYLAVLFLAVGCASTPQSSSNPGNIKTVADARLRTDVMRMIGVYESAVGGSSQPKLVSASSAGKTGSTFIEHWVVDSNGKKVTYEVKLTPSPRGGVDAGITRLRSQ